MSHIISRLEHSKILLTTYLLESPRTGMVSNLEIWGYIAATHNLQSKKQAPSASLKSIKLQ